MADKDTARLADFGKDRVKVVNHWRRAPKFYFVLAIK